MDATLYRRVVRMEHQSVETKSHRLLWDEGDGGGYKRDLVIMKDENKLKVKEFYELESIA